jgi:hypothetical protein
MKMNSEPAGNDRLVDFVLQDEQWEELNVALKLQTLGRFRSRQRVRRFARRVCGVTALAAALAGAALWFDHRATPSPQVKAVNVPAPQARGTTHSLTDKELLAAFPRGSCFIAEVDGKKELVFLDPEKARTYLGPNWKRN